MNVQTLGHWEDPRDKEVLRDFGRVILTLVSRSHFFFSYFLIMIIREVCQRQALFGSAKKHFVLPYIVEMHISAVNLSAPEAF